MFLGLKMKPLVKEAGFLSCDGVYYGYVDNYLISISYHNNMYELFVELPIYSFGRDLYETIKDYIIEHSDEYGISAHSINSSGISFFFKRFAFQKMYSFMYRFLAELGTCPDNIKDICCNCCNKINEEGQFVRVGYHVHLVDNECIEIIKNDPPEKKSSISSGHPISGMVGALLFGFIAMSGYLFAAYRGYVCSWLLFLIPVLLMFGFIVFGGKPSVFMIVLVSVVPVLFFGISVIGLLSAEIGINWFSSGYSFTVIQLLSNSYMYYKNAFAEMNPFVTKQVITGGLFLLLGISFALTFSVKAKNIANVHIIKEYNA